jgi:RNA polymerase sigma-70 factor (ECF subfamily)
MGNPMPREAVSLRDSTRSSSTSLIQGLKNQDEKAWQRLLDLYVPLVFSWCRRAGLQSEDCADVMQEVFRSVLGGIAGFRYVNPTDTFRGWLRTIARNKIRDYFRRRNAEPMGRGGTTAHQRFLDVAEIESATAPAADPMAGLIHRGVNLIRAEFDERTWQAFWLTAVEKHSGTEAAELLRMSPGAVRQAKYKVLRRLRQELGDVE